jgi:hypothetical protein
VDCIPDPLKMENAQQENQLAPTRCTLYDSWLKSDNDSIVMKNSGSNTGGGSSFQSILGVSSLQIAMRNTHFEVGDSYPFINTHYDTSYHVETFLDLRQAASVGKFVTNLILQLVMSPKLPLLASDYGQDVNSGVQLFMAKHADLLATHGVQVKDITSAASKFVEVTNKFNNSFDLTILSLELLGYHEYNDQLMELERAFLLPPSADSTFFVTTSDTVVASSYRHVIHGPSPLDARQIDFLPRLRAAMEIAKVDDSVKAWNVVNREAFFVVDSLESASCVLDNHLIRHEEKVQDIIAS